MQTLTSSANISYCNSKDVTFCKQNKVLKSGVGFAPSDQCQNHYCPFVLLLLSLIPGVVDPVIIRTKKSRSHLRKASSSAGDPITRRAQPSRGSCIIHPVGQVRSSRSMGLRRRAPLSRALSPSRSRSWSGTRSGRCTGLRRTLSHVRAAIATAGMA